tara:strand:- start:121 stop:1551 length:1431 start_codon:yes stop_codon:yes gene_type:complete
MTAYVDSWLYVPIDQLHEPVGIVKRQLTIRPKQMRQDAQPKPIYLYDDSREGYLGLPIDWGLNMYPDLEVEDRTVRGGRIRVPTLPDPHHPLAPEGQAEFMQAMYDATHDYFAFLAKAGTGTGKTVTFLWTAARRARRTLVIVPSESLMRQWVKEIHDKLGVPKHMIGTIQQDTCEYDCPFVVGLVHTIVRRDFDREVLESFGTVGWDEVHRMGAFTFSQSVGMFPAEAKIAMTATDKRKDGADKVFLWYFGFAQVTAETETLPCQVKVLKYKAEKVWGSSREALIKCLTLDKKRNNKILKLVAKLYDAGRYVLLIGDNVKHLQTLKLKLIDDGIPEEHIGQFTASYYPEGKKKGSWAEKSKKMPPEELDRIRQDDEVCIILATYGSFKEGVDIPRLDAGIDVTPRTEGIQVIGRIRRRRDGKPLPVWYTIDDVKSKRLRSYTKARIEDYLESDNVEVLGYDSGTESNTRKKRSKT